jgi:Dolichyl-phosphate-mannose-protein mannosyltransferase
MRIGVEWRWALPRLLALFLVARLIVLLAAVSVEWLATPSSAGPGGSLLRATERPVLASLTSWDAVYYLGIANDGYQVGPVNGPYPETVFFPLYPALTAAVAAPLGGDLPLSGVVVANAFGLLGLVGAYALARRRLSRRAALLAAAFVALGPGSVAFSMAYSDSLFLTLACGTFLAAGRGGDRGRVAAGGLAILAGLTRLQGAFLFVPMLWLFWQQDRGKARWSWLATLGGPIGLAAYGLWVGGLTGDPLGPILAQGAWDFGAVSDAVAEPWVVAVAAVIYGATVVLSLRLLWDRRRARVDGAGVAWGAVNLAALVVARRVQSLPRYLAPVTQLAEQLASGTYSPRTVRLVVAASVAAYALLAVLHFALKLAP